MMRMKSERYLFKNLFEKVWKYGIFPVFVIIGLTFTMGFYYERNIYIKLYDITVELGEKLPEEITNYTSLLPENSNLSLESNVPLDENGYTTKTGNYLYYLVYNDNNSRFSQMTNVKAEIKVVDTINPTIKVKDNIQVEYGGKLKASDVALCYDLSECEIIIEEFDTNKSGDYELKIAAIDSSDNVSYGVANVHVKEKPKPVVRTVYNYNPYAGMGYKSMNDNNNGRNALLSAEEKNNLRMQIVNYAKQFVGNPYVYGGTSLTKGTDCSGFTMSVYANFGYSLPRSAINQGYVGYPISASELIPGDLIIYTYGHVGMYIGNGLMVHAGTPQTGIAIQSIFGGNRVYRRIIY